MSFTQERRRTLNVSYIIIYLIRLINSRYNPLPLEPLPRSSEFIPLPLGLLPRSSVTKMTNYVAK